MGLIKVSCPNGLASTTPVNSEPLLAVEDDDWNVISVHVDKGGSNIGSDSNISSISSDSVSCWPSSSISMNSSSYSSSSSFVSHYQFVLLLIVVVLLRILYYIKKNQLSHHL